LTLPRRQARTTSRGRTPNKSDPLEDETRTTRASVRHNAGADQLHGWQLARRDVPGARLAGARPTMQAGGIPAGIVCGKRRRSSASTRASFWVQPLLSTSYLAVQYVPRHLQETTSRCGGAVNQVIDRRADALTERLSRRQAGPIRSCLRAWPASAMQDLFPLKQPKHRRRAKEACGGPHR